LKEAIQSSERLAKTITLEIGQSSEIEKLGIELMGLSILAIVPNKETLRALEAQAREEILRSADDALYERRNASIQQERRVKENELNTEIAVETKKRQIRETQLDAERSVKQKQNEMKEEQLSFDTALEEKKQELIELTVANQRAEADAKAYELSAVMNSLQGVAPGVLQALTNVGMKPDKLIAIAFQELAENAGKIGQLNITPDLLQGIMAELVVRYNTIQQAQFYIERLGADFSDYLSEDFNYRKAVETAVTELSAVGRLQLLDRQHVPNFIFGEQDTVVVLGQDGLVANTLKYLREQPLIGVNPDPRRWDGVLLPFTVKDLRQLMPEVLRGQRQVRAVTLAKAELNDGQSLYGVNDLFIGRRTHVSARYQLELDGLLEQQSSSGIIVSTGMGSTGWLKSVLAGAAGIVSHAAQLQTAYPAPVPAGIEAHASGNGSGPLRRGAALQLAWDHPELYFTVREPFPSRTTSANLVFGRINSRLPLRVTSQMPEDGVIFSDGVESDYLEFNSGVEATIGLAEKQGRLVV
ncbi:hypothetical protein KC345_g11109, partial [Hortaea werneckii]